ALFQTTGLPAADPSFFNTIHQIRSFSVYANDPETCRSNDHQIPVFPCPASNFGKTQSGIDFEKAARSGTTKPLPHHAFPAGPCFSRRAIDRKHVNPDIPLSPGLWT
ncbi:hypothetical protein, partial [Sphingomonas sp. CFBP 13706]|uniref:hypothetical protein n=1 Tax=Sphingomonas sp. CFBP 13706 TaxID=2775314 RepID=UPI001A7E692B